MLGIPQAQLEFIEGNQKGLGRRKRGMFQLAIKIGLTWRQVIEALRNMGEGKISADVCEMFNIVPASEGSASEEDTSLSHRNLFLSVS